VLLIEKKAYLSLCVIAPVLLVLTGCGSSSSPQGSGNYSGMIVSQEQAAVLGLAAPAGVANVTLTPDRLTGGASAQITIQLGQPAPSGGVLIQLKSSDPSVVTLPATIKIAAGQTRATVPVSTSTVTTATAVSISAFSGATIAGSSMKVLPETRAASDGTTAGHASLNPDVTAPNPGATFQGCWYSTGGHHYQAAVLSANPGTYPFDADLYYGMSCNPSQKADEIGFGTPLTFTGFSWLFWFDHFPGKSDMSAIWYVGTDHSKCINYKIAPHC